MEEIVLKLVGIVCSTLFAIIIIITRKDDIGIGAIVIATLFELIAVFIIYLPIDNIIILIERIKMLIN